LHMRDSSFDTHIACHTLRRPGAPVDLTPDTHYNIHDSYRVPVGARTTHHHVATVHSSTLHVDSHSTHCYRTAWEILCMSTSPPLTITLHMTALPCSRCRYFMTASTACMRLCCSVHSPRRRSQLGAWAVNGQCLCCLSHRFCCLLRCLHSHSGWRRLEHRR